MHISSLWKADPYDKGEEKHWYRASLPEQSGTLKLPGNDGIGHTFWLAADDAVGHWWQDVLIIGSGGTVHNLRGLNWASEGIDGWAEQFDNWIQSKLETWDTEALFQYRELAPYAREAVPTNEHFIPLLLAMGTGDAGRNAKLFHRSYQYGNLSLSCWQYTGISRQCLHVS